MFLSVLEAKVAQYFSSQHKIHYLGLWAAIIFLWVLFFPYAGITHDAQLYTLQALSHVEPELYKNDIFLRFGSQDQFTLFSSLYAAFIKIFGVESAGAYLTLISHFLFFGAVFLLAWQFMPYGLAVFALGLVLVVSSYYGSEHVFHYIEMFLTPRMLAEAFVLFAIVVWLNKKYIVAAIFLLLALSLHPLMAAAGFVLLLSGIYITYWRSLSLVVVMGCALLFVVSNTSQLLTHWQFDGDWLGIIEKHSTHLFFYYWSIDDIANALVPLISLMLSCLFFTVEKEKKLAIAALFTGVMAVLVHGVGGDSLDIAIITQGQAWRWLWLTTLVAILLLPNLIINLWKAKSAGKIIVITLISAWLIRSQFWGLVVAIWAFVLAGALKVNWGSEFFWGVSKWIGVVLLLLPFFLLFGVSHFHITVITALFNGSHLQDFYGMWHESAFALYLLLMGAVVFTSFHRALRFSLAIGLFICSASAFWFMGKSWLPQSKLESVFKQYEEVRNIVPVGEDVFTLWPPVSTWTLLQRPNYISGIQMAGLVFTRETAIEADRRLKAILLLCPFNDTEVCNKDWADWLPSVTDFSPFCKTSGVRFLMSSTVINAKGLVAIPLSNAQSLPYLYQCTAE